MWSVTNRKLTERYEENMTGEQFVKLCYDEKEAILSESISEMGLRQLL